MNHMRLADSERLERINQYLIIGNEYAQILEKLHAEVQNKLPLTPDDYDDLSLKGVGYIDLIIGRFGKLQDLITLRIFPLILELEGEDNREHSVIDNLNKLEKLRYLESAYHWRDLRELRRKIDAADRADNLQHLVDSTNALINEVPFLIAYWKEELITFPQQL